DHACVLEHIVKRRHELTFCGSVHLATPVCERPKRVRGLHLAAIAEQSAPATLVSVLPRSLGQRHGAPRFKSAAAQRVDREIRFASCLMRAIAFAKLRPERDRPGPAPTISDSLPMRGRKARPATAFPKPEGFGI